MRRLPKRKADSIASGDGMDEGNGEAVKIRNETSDGDVVIAIPMAKKADSLRYGT